MMTRAQVEEMLNRVSRLPNTEPIPQAPPGAPQGNGGGGGGTSAPPPGSIPNPFYTPGNIYDVINDQTISGGNPQSQYLGAGQFATNNQGVSFYNNPLASNGFGGLDLAPSFLQGQQGNGDKIIQSGGKIFSYGPNGLTLLYDSGTGGGAGGFDTGPGYLNLAQQQFGFQSGPQFQEGIRQFNEQQGLAQQSSNRNMLGNQANAGLGLGSLVRGLSNDAYDRAKSPANYPAYLAALAGQPTGGDPVNSLLGQGFQIQNAPGTNPYSDPRFQTLLDSLYQYGSPASPGATDAVQQAYDTNPQAAQQFFSQSPENLARFFGAQQPAFDASTYRSPDYRTPVARVAAASGLDSIVDQPTNILAGEGGQPEHVQVTPLPGVTPAAGTAMSLGKALQPLGYVPHPLIQRLLSGQGISPNMLPDEVLMRLPSSLRQLLTTSIRAFVGDTGLEDFGQSQANFALPGGLRAGAVVH